MNIVKLFRVPLIRITTYRCVHLSQHNLCVKFFKFDQTSLLFVSLCMTVKIAILPAYAIREIRKKQLQKNKIKMAIH